MKWPWVWREDLEAAHKALLEQATIVEQQRQRLIDVAAAQVHLQLAKVAVEQAQKRAATLDKLLQIRTEEQFHARRELNRRAVELLMVVDLMTAKDKIWQSVADTNRELRGPYDARGIEIGDSP